MANLEELITRSVVEILKNKEKSEGIKVGVSARHVHLSQKDLDTLFGKGYQLHVKKMLMGDQFAAEDLKELWGKGQFRSEYGLPLSYAKGFTFRDESCDIVHLRNRARIPMRVSDEAVMRQFAKLCFIKSLGEDKPRGLESINDALFIAAPAADMKPLKMEVTFDSSLTATKAREALRQAERKNRDLALYPNTHRWERETIQNDAIRAEETRLQSVIEKSNIARYCEIDFIKTQPLPERKLYDPFICSLTPHGVLIHAKWGAEAEDATIKRYEQLRDAIIGKGGSL